MNRCLAQLMVWGLQAWAIFRVTVQRLFSHIWLSLATGLGLVVVVALAMSIPLYADSVYFQALLRQLSTRYDWKDTGASFRPGNLVGVSARERPLFAFTFRYIGQLHGSVEWEMVEPLDAYLSHQAATTLGLPQKLLVRHFRTADYKLLANDLGTPVNSKPLALAGFGFVSDLENHITILAGKMPGPPALPADPIGVLVSDSLAEKLSLQVDDLYFMVPNTSTQATPILVKIAGVWKAQNPKEDFWFYDPTALARLLLVPEATFRQWISPQVNREVYLGLWYLVLDGSDIHASDINRLLYRITVVQQWESYYLRNADIDMAIVDAMKTYQRAAGQLTILLYAFSVPIIGLLLAFIGMLSELSVDRHRNEIATMRSRGATTFQIIGMTMLEGSLLGLIALVAGFPLAALLAEKMSQARSFLDFSLQQDLPIRPTKEMLIFGLAMACLAVVAQLVPTFQAAQRTVTNYKWEQSRNLHAPWWQRIWLDVLLFIPLAYGLYLLRRQGSIALPSTGLNGIGDPFQNPLLFLVPAFAIIATTLLILRVLPGAMNFVGWLASLGRGVGFVLATRHLARRPGLYNAPILLLVWTLSLAMFTASMALVLDRHLSDQIYYRDGADMTVVESGRTTSSPIDKQQANATELAENSSSEGEGAWQWVFLPVSEHLVEGVRAASRVGSYPAIIQLADGIQAGRYLGVDRVDFVKVAFWRRDFADDSLGALMNALAATADGVLLPRDFMNRHALKVGDTIFVNVKTYSQNNELRMRVVGNFNLFPTWYPDQTNRQEDTGLEEQSGPLFVGNLDYLFEEIGGSFPYQIWLKTEPDVDYNHLVERFQSLGLGVEEWRAPRLTIAREQQKPERQGLFGLLSIGFISAAILTVLGFVYYTIFSLHRRSIELGVLRAIGLSAGQMVASLAWELLLLILAGMVTGTGLGMWVSQLFIPYLQIGSDPAARIPPFVVEIAWSSTFHIYGLFSSLLFVTLGCLTTVLMRIKIFQVIKLGEAL